MKREVLAYDGLQRCPYREGQVARLPLYRQRYQIGPEETDQRFAKLERRVGRSLYSPACPTCSACLGVRILVNDFKPSKSQRRVRNRWKGDWRVDLGEPTVTEEKVRLYNQHKVERGLSTSTSDTLDIDGYQAWLMTSCFQTIEMSYYMADRLVGVGIVDLGKESASSVYFYFDPSPEMSALSPGVFAALQEIELCRETGRKYLYLGYYVKDCRALAYKNRYKPYEVFYDGDWRSAPI